MEERKFSGEDSLRLISQMISSSRQNLEIGSGNIFLYYGYLSLALSVATFAAMWYTGSALWNFLWMLMFAPMVILWIKGRREKAKVTTYTDKMLSGTWNVVALLMCVSLAAIMLGGAIRNGIYFSLMQPLALILVCVGSMITGIVVRENGITACSVIGFIIPVLILTDMRAGTSYSAQWNLLTGLSFICSLVIPGHLLNRKAAKSC